MRPARARPAPRRARRPRSGLRRRWAGDDRDDRPRPQRPPRRPAQSGSASPAQPPTRAREPRDDRHPRERVEDGRSARGAGEPADRLLLRLPDRQRRADRATPTCRSGFPQILVAQAQAAPFSQVCQVYAPMYRQITNRGLVDAVAPREPAARLRRRPRTPGATTSRTTTTAAASC